jgi:hypothetical protein
MPTQDGYYMQKLVTLTGDTNNTNIVQTASKWCDTGGSPRAVVRVEIPMLSANMTWYLETCSTRDSAEEGGGWETVQSYTSADTPPISATLYLHADADGTNNKKLERFLRWRIKSSAAAAWEATFSVAVVLK